MINILSHFQVDKDAIMVCYGKTVKIVTMEGNPRQSKKLVSRLEFDFTIESIGKFGSYGFHSTVEFHRDNF